MVASLSYYGLALNVGDLPGSVYLNFIASGLIEIPGFFLAVPMLEWWGRRPATVLCWLLGGIGCLLSGLLPRSPASLAFALLGKISVATAFCILYNYTTELFPTTIRHTATALCSLCARIGAMAAPQIHLLADYGPAWLPIVIYGAFALAAAAFDLFLPETRGQPMPDNMAQELRLARFLASLDTARYYI